MLRSNVSDAVALQSAFGFPAKVSKNPLRGRCLYDRRGDLAGYLFTLAGMSVGSASGTSRPGADVSSDRYIGFLARIVRACDRSQLSIYASGESNGIGPETRIVMSLPPAVLLLDRLAGALVRANSELRSRGFRLCIAFEASELAAVREIRELRKVLYLLADDNIRLIMRNPELVSDAASHVAVIERAVSEFSVTPQWLGVGVCEDSFDHSRYIEQVTKLGNAIHEGGKSVIFEGVGNSWQESFVTSLPVSLFSPSGADNDVYV